MVSNYSKYRGKCKEMCEEAIKEDVSLRIVRGYYIDRDWGSQQHWWCIRPDGTVYDPTAKQFPSKGLGEYIPFDGMVTCETCGKVLPEEEAQFASNYALCSSICYGKLVGVI